MPRPARQPERFVAKLLLEAADLDELDGVLRRILTTGPTRQTIDRRMAYRVTVLQTAAATAQGRFDDADRHIDEGLPLTSDDYDLFPYQRALLQWLRGEVAGVGFEIPAGPIDGIGLQLLAGNALAAAGSGDTRAATQSLQRLCDHRTDIDRYPFVAPALAAWATRAATIVGPGPWVDLLDEVFEPHAGTFVVMGGHAGLLGAVEGYQGALAQLGGDTPRAETLLHTAIDRNHRHGLAPFEAFAHHDLARLYADTERPDDSRTAAHHATSIAEPTGMKTLVERTRHLLGP